MFYFSIVLQIHMTSLKRQDGYKRMNKDDPNVSTVQDMLP